MRASRLVSILLLLQTRDRMTARELAAWLEVSERTVYRDVQSLSAAGIPVYGEAGHEGGYRLVGGYRTRLTGLTAAEAESLFLTGLPVAAADLGLGEAQLKLMTALPPESRDRAARLRGRVHLDARSWCQGADAAPHLAVVADAVWHQRCVRLRYLRWEAPHEVTRTVEPYGVVLKGGSWYLVARRAGRFRTYRISRILAADVLDHGFKRAVGFDLSRHWQDYLDDYDARRYEGWAVLRLSPDGMHRLPHLAEPAVMSEAQKPRLSIRMAGRASPCRSSPTTRRSGNSCSWARTSRFSLRPSSALEWPELWPR